MPLHNVAGDSDHPITIAGPSEGAPAIFVAELERNTVSIVDSHDGVVKNLELDGRDLPVDGVKCEGTARYSHHITLENLLIRRHGNNQQTVGISTKCPAWNWVIRGNSIVGAGTGICLGNSDGTRAVRRRHHRAAPGRRLTRLQPADQAPESPGEIDLAPRSPLTSAGADAANPAQLPEWDRDFNGQQRMPGSIGAYATAGTNPGWRLALSLMPD